MPSETAAANINFGWMIQLMGALMTTLAIVALSQHAFATWSLSAPMVLVMDAYTKVMQVLFGWAQPYLQAALTWLGAIVGWRPTLHAHWRDVFALTSLFVLAIARTTSKDATLRSFLTLSSLVMGTRVFIGILFSALISGLLPLQSPNIATQLLIASLFGFFLLPFVLSPVEGGTKTALRGLTFLVGGIGAISALATFLVSEILGTVPGTGLLGIAAVIILIGLLLCLMGIHGPVGRRDPVNAPLFSADSAILTGFLGAFCFFAIDAGLKLAMG